MPEEERGICVRDVSAKSFISAYAEHLKNSDKFELPVWADTVKTAVFKELAPYGDDWYYIRAASIARKIYLRPGVGVGALQKWYGGSYRKGARTEHFRKASSGVIRSVIIQLEEMKVLDHHPNGGRRMTRVGLKNELPGDYGFDPLELGKDPEDLKWYVQAELQHGRWAMLGVAGAAAPEILTNMGISNLPNWHEAPLYDGYFTDATTLFWVQMLMMNWAEVRRWQDIRKPGSVSEDPTPFSNAKLPAGVVGYPGGIFDPLGYAKGDLKTLKAKEIANGRLAMVAFAGIMVQYDHTGVGPVANLVSHMADPAHNNVFAAKFIGF